MTENSTTTGDDSKAAYTPMESDEDEAEAAAIIAIIRALKSLSPDARRRIVGWATAKYGVTGHIPSSSAAQATGISTDGQAALTASVSEVDIESLQDFAELMDATQPQDDVERVIAACYWVQHRLKKNPFGSQDANTLLKQLGHQIDRIGDVFDAIRAWKPSPIIQIKKDGSHQQSRKQYRMTPAGTNVVVDAVRDGAFPKPVAS